MGTVVVSDKTTGRTYQFRNQDPGNLLDQGLKSGQYVPLRSDGTPANVYFFEGGVLIDGAPVNAYLQDVWYEGQKAILDPFYQNGSIIRPPDYIYALPEVQTPPDILATYNAYKGTPAAQNLVEAYTTGGSFASTLQNPWVLAGIGIFLVLVISGGGRKTSQSAAGGDLNL